MKTEIWMVIALLVMVASGHAMSLEEILAKNAEAHGGIRNIKNIGTMRTAGSITQIMGANEITSDIRILYKRGNKMRLEQTYHTETLVIVYDGKTAWTYNAMQNTEPVELPAEGTKHFREQSSMDGELVAWKELGLVLAYGGMAEVDGKPAYRIDVTTPDQERQAIYVDATTFLETKKESTLEQQGVMRAVETRYSDYRSVQGITIPMKVEQFIDGDRAGGIVLNKVEVNVPADDRMFSKGFAGAAPTPAEESAAAKSAPKGKAKSKK